MIWEVSLLPVLEKRVIFCQTCHLSNCGRWNKFAALGLTFIHPCAKLSQEILQRTKIAQLSPPKFTTQKMWNLAQILYSHRFVKICDNLARIPHIFQSMKICCGVNHKHNSAESGIWNLAFKHHRPYFIKSSNRWILPFGVLSVLWHF